MSQQTTGRGDHHSLKQPGEETNRQLNTRNGGEGKSPSEREGGRDRDDLGEDPDQIVLSSLFDQLRGVIGRYPDPGQEFVFEFDSVAERAVHMVGVRGPLEVEWYVGDDLVRVEQLTPWVGYASAQADRVIERRPER